MLIPLRNSALLEWTFYDSDMRLRSSKLRCMAH